MKKFEIQYNHKYRKQLTFFSVIIIIKFFIFNFRREYSIIYKNIILGKKSNSSRNFQTVQGLFLTLSWVQTFPFWQAVAWECSLSKSCVWAVIGSWVGVSLGVYMTSRFRVPQKPKEKKRGNFFDGSTRCKSLSACDPVVVQGTKVTESFKWNRSTKSSRTVLQFFQN